MHQDEFKRRHKQDPGAALWMLFAQQLLIAEQINTLMSVIKDFAEKQNAFNAQLSADIDSVVSSVTGITTDIQSLNDKITALQNSSGTVTPEDQALIDQLVTDGTALQTKADAAAAAVKALDDAPRQSFPPRKIPHAIRQANPDYTSARLRTGFFMPKIIATTGALPVSVPLPDNARRELSPCRIITRVGIPDRPALRWHLAPVPILSTPVCPKSRKFVDRLLLRFDDQRQFKIDFVNRTPPFIPVFYSFLAIDG